MMGEPAMLQTTEPREALITTAVKFLQNAKVRASPFHQRRSFLLRKGLTNDEIEEAIRRSGTTGDQHIGANGSGQQLAVVGSGAGQQSSSAGIHNNSAVVPMPVMAPTTTVWMKLREFFGAASFIAAVVYALYQIYKKYLMRWLFGVKSADSSDSAVAVSDTELRQSVVSTAAMVTELKQLATRTNDQLESFIRTTSTTGPRIDGEIGRSNVSDIKDELKSLKSLLLSKNQFPPVPSGSPLLPAWQLRGSSSTNKITTSNATSTAASAAMSTDQSLSRSHDLGNQLGLTETISQTEAGSSHGASEARNGSKDAVILSEDGREGRNGIELAEGLSAAGVSEFVENFELEKNHSMLQVRINGSDSPVHSVEQEQQQQRQQDGLVPPDSRNTLENSSDNITSVFSSSTQLNPSSCDESRDTYIERCDSLRQHDSPSAEHSDWSQQKISLCGEGSGLNDGEDGLLSVDHRGESMVMEGEKNHIVIETEYCT